MWIYEICRHPQYHYLVLMSDLNPTIHQARRATDRRYDGRIIWMLRQHFGGFAFAESVRSSLGVPESVRRVAVECLSAPKEYVHQCDFCYDLIPETERLAADGTGKSALCPPCRQRMERHHEAINERRLARRAQHQQSPDDSNLIQVR